MTDSKRIDRKDAEVKGTLTATVSMALDGLSDVDASSPSDGDALTWVDAHSAWEPVAGSGGTPTAITVADESSDTTCFPAFFTAATGDLGPKTDASALTYNASTGAMGATRFNALSDVQVLTSASDTTATLDTTYANDLAVSGTGILYIINLGDARTYSNGKKYNITNGTAEFVGVINTDLTVFHRVPPRAYCECILLDNSTASGVWSSRLCDAALMDPAFGLNSFTDFNGMGATIGYYGESGWTLVSSGTAASSSGTNTASIAGRQGTWRNYAGTTAAGYSLIYSPGAANNYPTAGGCRAFEFSGGFAYISAAADEYIGRVGFGSNVTGGAHTEGAYFLYDRLGTDTHWQIKTVKTTGGAGTTLVDTGIAPLYGATAYNAYQKLRGEISSAGTRFDAWINNVCYSGSGGMANLPASTTDCRNLVVGITGSAYASVSRIIYYDYLRVQSYPTTLR